MNLHKYDRDHFNIIKEKSGMQRYLAEIFLSARTLAKWLILGSFIGILIGGISTVFGHVLLWANTFREQNSWIVLTLPAGGLLIVFLYRILKNMGDKGTNMVISSIHSSTDIPFKMAPLIFVTTCITHLCGGSSGREGAAIQLGGSISNMLGKVIGLNENDKRIIVMCGMSAGFSALFGTPMAAAIFSLEVISIGIMHYSALVPCVIASMLAHFIAKYFGIKPEAFAIAEIPAINVAGFLKILFFGALVGVVSIIFCIILHRTEHTYKQFIKNQYIRIFASGCIIILLTVILQTDRYLGSGMNIIESIFHGGSARFHDFLLKMIFTALTLGAGFKGGEIVPSFCIGATFGAVMAALFGLPVTLVAACGMVGVFCGVTNCPITSLLISFELFGFEGMPYFLITIAVSYMLSGYYGLYRSQKIMYSKTETNFVNTEAH